MSRPLPPDELDPLFESLTRHAPRDGYVQRFWARAAVPAPGGVAAWRWLPVAATALGLAIGIAAAGFSPGPAQGTRLGDLAGLPQGSLADTFAFKAGE
jgi:hypothetical protein